MPLDAVCLAGLTRELRGRIMGMRIDKVQQPERDLLLFSLRGNGDSARLLLCAGTGNARVHLTEASFEQPARLFPRIAGDDFLHTRNVQRMHDHGNFVHTLLRFKSINSMFNYQSASDFKKLLGLGNTHTASRSSCQNHCNVTHLFRFF